MNLCFMIFRSFKYLFEAVSKRLSANYVLKASFLEVYNEKVGFTSINNINNVWASVLR